MFENGRGTAREAIRGLFLLPDELDLMRRDPAMRNIENEYEDE
jgi:hypothetical protein